jgi:hypothetical protein
MVILPDDVKALTRIESPDFVCIHTGTSPAKRIHLEVQIWKTGFWLRGGWRFDHGGG